MELGFFFQNGGIRNFAVVVGLGNFGGIWNLSRGGRIWSFVVVRYANLGGFWIFFSSQNGGIRNFVVVGFGNITKI